MIDLISELGFKKIDIASDKALEIVKNFLPEQRRLTGKLEALDGTDKDIVQSLINASIRLKGPVSFMLLKQITLCLYEIMFSSRIALEDQKFFEIILNLEIFYLIKDGAFCTELRETKNQKLILKVRDMLIYYTLFIIWLPSQCP